MNVALETLFPTGVSKDAIEESCSEDKARVVMFSGGIGRANHELQFETMLVYQ